MERKSFLFFGRPRIGRDEIREVVDSLRSGWLSSGPKVYKFEEDFKRYMKVPYAVALNSCTAGLFLSLVVAGIDRGDEVIITPFTFAATANAILLRGAKPVFVDVDYFTMNIDPMQIERKITKRTKAIIPVHFAGRPCDMNNILALAQKYKLHIIQDAAHALEARYCGRKIGELGDLTAFSFYVNKNLTTGEGGMVTTQHKQWAEKIQILAFQGMTQNAWHKYVKHEFQPSKVVLAGFKFNMMDIQAAMGIPQLQKIEERLRLREKIWKTYDCAFQDLPLETPIITPTNIRHARHLYTILLNLNALKINRDQFRQELCKQKIGSEVHFVSLHLQPYYRKIFKFKPKDFPNANLLSERILSLPLSAHLRETDVERVICAAKKILKYYKR